MYRFLLFSYESYYPNGGIGDFYFSFNTIEEMEEEYERSSRKLCEYIDVFDTKTEEVINRSDYYPEVVAEVKEYLKQNN